MELKVFSSYLALLFFVVLAFNTSIFITQVFYEFIILLITIIKSLFNVFYLTLSQYPLTIILLLILIVRGRKRTRKNGILYDHLLNIFGNNEQCSICLLKDCDKVLPECGHYFHAKCIDPWIRKTEKCANCRTIVYKSTLSRGNSSPNYLKFLFKNNKFLIIFTFAISLFIVVEYSIWWQKTSFFSNKNSIDQSNKVTQNITTIQQFNEDKDKVLHEPLKYEFSSNQLAQNNKKDECDQFDFFKHK